MCWAATCTPPTWRTASVAQPTQADPALITSWAARTSRSAPFSTSSASCRGRDSASWRCHGARRWPRATSASCGDGSAAPPPSPRAGSGCFSRTGRAISRPRAATWDMSRDRPAWGWPRRLPGCGGSAGGSSPPDLGARAPHGVARRRDARARLLLLLGARRRRGRVLAPARLVRAYGSAAGPAAPLRGFRAAPGRDPGARRLASRGTHAARPGARARALASGTGLARRRTAARDPGRSHRRPGPRHPRGVSPRPHADGRAARVRRVRGAAVPLFRLLGGAVPRRAAVRPACAARRRVVQRGADRAVGDGALRPRRQRNAGRRASGDGIRRDRPAHRLHLVRRTAALGCRRQHGLVHPHDLTARSARSRVPGRLVDVMRTPLQFAAVSPHSIWPLGLIGVLVVSVAHVPGHGDPAARIFTDPARDALVIDLAPMDLPANTPHHGIAQPPVATLEIPVTGYIYGFRAEVVDSAGRVLPDELIHHFNLIDP